MAKKTQPLGTVTKPVIITRQILDAFAKGFSHAVITDPKTDPDSYADPAVKLVFHRLVLQSVKRHQADISWPDKTILATAEAHGVFARELAEQDRLKRLDFETFFETLDDTKAMCPVVTTKSGAKILGLACDF